MSGILGTRHKVQFFAPGSFDVRSGAGLGKKTTGTSENAAATVVPRVVPRTTQNASTSDPLRPIIGLDAFGETAPVQVIPLEGIAGMRT